MAEADITATVSVEAILHRTFRKFVQEISNDYGVQITSLDFDWVERIGNPAVLQECRVHSKTNIGWNPKS